MQCWFNAFWLAAQKFSTNQSFPNLRSVIYKGNSRYRYGTWGGTHLLRAIFTKYLSSKVPLRSRFRSMFKFNSRLKIVQSSSHYDSRLANYDRRVLSKSSSNEWVRLIIACMKCQFHPSRSCRAYCKQDFIHLRHQGSRMHGSKN